MKMVFGVVYISPEISSVHSNEATFEILENGIASIKEHYPNNKLLSIFAWRFECLYLNRREFVPFDTVSMHDSTFFDKNVSTSLRVNSDVTTLNNYEKNFYIILLLQV